MNGTNKVVIAAAGSGKTTHIVREALKARGDNVLITTYTESNEAEIRQKILDINGYIPSHIHVTTWFSFLISQGVRPFQNVLFDFDVRGMYLSERKSGFRYNNNKGFPVYWGEKNFVEHYFDERQRVYSDKLSKLVVKCDAASDGSVIDRISRIYRQIFVDEVQDLAGYDLDILTKLFGSPSNVMLVGDPRQVTYLTHNERQHFRYAGGLLLDFLKAKLPKGISYEIDETTLVASHRNSAAICSASSKLYPQLKPTVACTCKECRETERKGAGLFIVRERDLDSYMRAVQPMQLRYSSGTRKVDPLFPCLNFGESKGRGFDHVMIFPTDDMVSWMKNNAHELKDQTRAKLYVAFTRARHSVAVAYDFEDGEIMDGFSVYR